MSPSQLELWQIIASRQHGVLATTRADGAPQMSNVLYVPEDATHVLRLSTTADRFKSRNLERDPAPRCTSPAMTSGNTPSHRVRSRCPRSPLHRETLRPTSCSQCTAPSTDNSTATLSTTR
jgi:hypothetical protein